MTKLAIVTCYKHPDYIRAKTLRAAAGLLDSVEVIVIKNTHRGVLRYPEVLWRVLWVRIFLRPDIYLVTFRGYEIFPFVRLLSIGKTLWYDEFINPIEWAVLEQKKLPDWKVFRVAYRLLVLSVQKILTDTQSHADFSARLTGISREHVVAIPVSTEESSSAPYVINKDKALKVFFYGTILPLHGFEIILQATELLKNEAIEFVFAGGKKHTAAQIEIARQRGAKIHYHAWLEFDELMKTAATADVCLGGPFGNTVQSQYVITGKTYQFLELKKPVIIGQNKESSIFTDKHDALLVKQGDAQALAQTILWAHTHRGELGDIAKNGYEVYRQKLSNRVVAEKLAELLGASTKKRQSK